MPQCSQGDCILGTKLRVFEVRCGGHRAFLGPPGALGQGRVSHPPGPPEAGADAPSLWPPGCQALPCQLTVPTWCVVTPDVPNPLGCWL